MKNRKIIFPPWAFLIILMLSYLITGINTYRLHPVLTSLMAFLDIDTDKIGFLMSICTFATLAVSIPFGIALYKIGCWRAIIIAGCLEVMGSLLGFLWTDYIGIAVSQIIFGVANAIFCVCAPYVLQIVYDKRRFSVVIGYLTAFQTVGMAVAYIAFPTMTSDINIPKVWLFTVFPSVLLIAASIFVKLFVDSPQDNSEKNIDFDVSADIEFNPFKDKLVWITAISGFLIMFSAGCVLSFATSFLTSERGLDEALAAKIVLSSSIMGMVCSAFVGKVTNRFGKRKVFIGIVLLMALSRYLLVIAPTGILLNIVICIQGVPAASIVILNAIIPGICPNVSKRPICISMVSTAVMTGMALSSVVFGTAIGSMGYNAALIALAPFSLVGLIGIYSVE